MYIYILIVVCLFGKGISYHYCYYYSCWQTTRWFLLLNLSMYCPSIYLLIYHKVNHAWIGKYIHTIIYHSSHGSVISFCFAMLFSCNQWDFQGPRLMGPLALPILWDPYHSYKNPQQLWVFVWEACLWKGSQVLGSSPEVTVEPLGLFDVQLLRGHQASTLKLQSFVGESDARNGTDGWQFKSGARYKKDGYIFGWHG